MALTYEPIATNTLASDTGAITFSSIPQTYTDLVLVYSGGMATNTGYAISYRINGSSSGIYNALRFYASGSGAQSTDQQYGNNQLYTLITSTFNPAAVNVTHFFDYTNTTTKKTMLAEQWNRGYVSDGMVAKTVGMIDTTSAITSIQFSPEFIANLLAGGTATLYGIKAA
jgi:hypothetical protein